MNWLDIVLVLLILAVAGLEMFRGFGRAVFDALFLYGALWLAHTLSFPLAASVHFVAHGAGINHSVAYFILFLLFGVLSLFVSWWVYHMTHVDAGMFNGFLGLLAGIAAGMMLAHGLVKTMAMSSPDGVVSDSTVGQEMLTFPTYHSLINTMTGEGTYRRELPDMKNGR